MSNLFNNHSTFNCFLLTFSIIDDYFTNKLTIEDPAEDKYDGKKIFLNLRYDTTKILKIKNKI
jgi:hypothetical protein